MHGAELRSQYLERLAAELRAAGVGVRLRRRIVAEAADHLAEAAQTAQLAGAVDPAASAIAAFGEPRELAARFADELAVRVALRSAGATFLVFLMMCLLWAALTWRPIRSALPWVSAGGDTPLSFIALQVVFVAGFLTAVRAFLQRREAAPRPERVRYIRRGNLVVVVLVAGLLAAEVPTFVSHAAAVRDTWAGRGLAAGVAALGVLLAAAVVALVGAWRHSGAVPSGDRDGQAPPDDALADLAAFASLLLESLRRRTPTMAHVIDRCVGWGSHGRAALARRMPAAAAWLDPRGHAWRFCVLAAVAIGIVGAVMHGATDGGLPAWNARAVGLAIYAGVVLLVVEAAAVLVAAALLGRFLGLLPPGRRLHIVDD